LSNTFTVLLNSGAFMQSLTAALEDCHDSLYAQFMTYEGDATGQVFSDLLTRKAAAGLDVRLMVDGYTDVVISDVYPILLHRLGSVRDERARTRALFESLRARGVGVRRTAPPGVLGCYMLYRNHKKMVVLDERIAFVGGINISDHNFAWHDFMVRIEGPLVRDLVRDFRSTWDGATIPFTAPNQDGDFLLNQCAGRYSIFAEVLDMIGRAEQRIVIESPYLLGDHIERALRRAAERGVQVTIIIPYHSNKLMYRLWSRKLRRRLAHPNAAIYGYQEHGGMTHARLLIVDGRWTSFGSFNMIELEGLTQKELNIFSSDADLIAQLEAFVAQDLAHSTPLPVPRIAGERFTYNVLYAFFKRWTNRLLRDPDWKAVYC
jgi:cardiolipin synthase